MARKLRLESEGGIYHVINRGNYRMDLFRAAKTRAAFLKCLGEACEKTGWRVHAWCVMSNHYHVALETPRANLVDGMRWLQGTFAVRFNRLRKERGHLFQDRYKSLITDPAEGLGPLCHYIHLNPVRAHLCSSEKLAEWRWTSVSWLMDPSLRPAWYDPRAALDHAGSLVDTPAGRQKYLEYLVWLAQDEPARKAQQFDRMCRGWIIGSREFRKTVIEEHQQAAGLGIRRTEALRGTRETIWEETLTTLLERLGRRREDLAREGKSVSWKLALASAMKSGTTVTNRWLGASLYMGSLHEVSRKVSAWARNPDTALTKKLE